MPTPTAQLDLVRGRPRRRLPATEVQAVGRVLGSRRRAVPAAALWALLGLACSPDFVRGVVTDSGGSTDGGLDGGGLDGGGLDGGGFDGGGLDGGGSDGGGSGGDGGGGDGGGGDSGEPLVLDYPEQRVGIFYLAWHAYAAQAWASLPADQRHTVEEVIRGEVDTFGALALDPGVYGAAQAFHWHQQPAAGFYCMYRPRPGEDGTGRPACPDAEAVAASHAALLWDAGVDFVYVDLTNLPTWSDFADVLGLRPFEVLLEEWSALRRAGIPTPQVAAWLPLRAVGAGEEALVHRLLDVYAAAPDDLLLTHDGQPVLFVVASGELDATLWAEVEAAGVLPVPLWGNLSADQLASGIAGWMQPCTQDGAFTTLLTPDQPCAQGYTTTSPLGTVLSASRSFQVGYASLPYQASGRLDGLTLQKQWETALAVQPDYLLINAWNEHIAQPQANPYDPALGELRRSMGVSDVPDSDASADWLWVDLYGADLGRDLEPTVQDGGAGYALLQSCLRVWRTGARACDDAAEACCQLAEGSTQLYSFRRAGGEVTGVDHVVTADAAELAALRADGAWTEVCNPHYGPPGLCGGGTTGDGPFGLYPAEGEGRVAIWRCYTGVDHLLSTDPACEGTTVEQRLGWAATTPSSAMPRPLRRCYDEDDTTHLHWLASTCPDGTRTEGVLGYVR